MTWLCTSSAPTAPTQELQRHWHRISEAGRDLQDHPAQPSAGPTVPSTSPDPTHPLDTSGVLPPPAAPRSSAGLSNVQTPPVWVTPGSAFQQQAQTSWTGPERFNSLYQQDLAWNPAPVPRNSLDSQPALHSLSPSGTELLIQDIFAPVKLG